MTARAVATLNGRTYTAAELQDAAARELETRDALRTAGSIAAAARQLGLSYHGFYARCRAFCIATSRGDACSTD